MRTRDSEARGAVLRRRGERGSALATSIAATAVSASLAAAALAATAITAARTSSSVTAADAAAALAATAVTTAVASAGAILPKLRAHVRSARLGVRPDVWRVRQLVARDGRLFA